ncbi:reverse transcriptase domain-containing protein [Tanacetum coccineum]
MVHQPAAPLQQAENIKVAIHLEYLEESIILGGGLIDKGKKAMCEVLKANLDVVAWKPTDMIRVPRTLDEHKLGVKEGTPKVRQKKRGQALERSKVVNEEVQKLVEARIMREVTYHSWISNPVLVKKHDGSWRMCLDFTDLNKACPNDCYPLPEINWKVESLCGYLIKCFLDSYKGAEEGMFMGHTISKDGIQACGEKAKAIIDMPSPRTLKDSDFAWTEEAKKALKEMKKQMVKLPTLPAPIKGETLIIYLLVAKEAISVVLHAERGDKEMPVYFVGQKLQLPEVIYPPREKLDLAIIHTTRRLRRYFQAHPIAVVTDQPIKQVLSKAKNLGRLEKWAIELGEHDISYRPPEEPVKETEEVVTNTWKLFTNNSSNEGGSGAEGIEFTYALRFKFNASNNEADYEALLARLRITESMGVKHIGQRSKQDGLCKFCSLNKKGTSRGTIVQVNKRDGGDGDVEEEGNTWFIPFKEYLEHATLLDGKGKVRRLKARANQYVVLEWVIYQRSFLGPWLRCVGLEQDEYVIREIHEGSCSMHLGPWSIVTKAMQLG